MLAAPAEGVGGQVLGDACGADTVIEGRYTVRCSGRRAARTPRSRRPGARPPDRRYASASVLVRGAAPARWCASCAGTGSRAGRRDSAPRRYRVRGRVGVRPVGGTEVVLHGPVGSGVVLTLGAGRGRLRALSKVR